MSEKPPSWRRYDVPGDEPGEKIRPENPDPETKPAPPSIGEAPFVPYGDPHASSSSSVPPLIAASAAAGRGVGLIVGIVGGVAGLAVAGGVGLFFLADGDGGGLGGGGRPDMHSQAGIDELIADLKDDGAGTALYDLTLYPDYAVAYVAVPGGRGDRYQGYYYDGSLDDDWSNGTNTESTFELSEIDGSLLGGFCEKAEKLVENPGDCYVIVDRPEEGDTDGGWYSAYVSNDFSEGGYIEFDLEGNEVNRTTW